MDTVCLAVIIAIFVLLTMLTIFMVHQGVKAIKCYKLVQRTPTSICVDVDKGLVEVKGTIEPIPGHQFNSPLTETTCVLYHSTIQEEVSSGKRRNWHTIFERKGGNAFLVRDDSGLTKVVTAGADLDMQTILNEVTSFYGGMSGASRDALNRLNLPLKGTFGVFHRKYRLHEEVLRPNSKVYVLGSATEIEMEPKLAADPKVNPYTITKKDVLIVSTRSEETVASNLLWKGILLIGGAILIDIGSIISILFFIL
jgi:hypothetical protein